MLSEDRCAERGNVQAADDNASIEGWLVGVRGKTPELRNAGSTSYMDGFLCGLQCYVHNSRISLPNPFEEFLEFRRVYLRSERVESFYIQGSELEAPPERFVVIPKKRGVILVDSEVLGERVIPGSPDAGAYDLGFIIGAKRECNYDIAIGELPQNQ